MAQRPEDAAIARKAAALIDIGRYKYSCNALDSVLSGGGHLLGEYKRLYGKRHWFNAADNPNYESGAHRLAEYKACRVAALTEFASYLEMGVL